MKIKRTYRLRWHEAGRWHTSALRFPSRIGAREHAEIIGAATGRYTISPVRVSQPKQQEEQPK